MCSVNVWISPGLLDSKDSGLRDAVLSQEGGHDYAFSGMDIVLQNFKVQSHRVMDWLLGHAVILLATLGRVCVCVDERRAGGKAGSNYG